MSKSGKSDDWDTLWTEYTKTMKKWMENLEALQKTSADVQEMYKEVMSKAVSESSQKTMKEFQENWQRAMTQAGVNAFKQFGENWQNSMGQSGLEQLKTYGEIMNKFAETWQKMWKPQTKG